MGALDVEYLGAELEGHSKFGSLELGVEADVIEGAVKVLLDGLGEDSSREGLRKTPLRVAKALREGTRGYGQNVKDIVQGALFPEAGLDSGAGHAGGVGGLVVVRDIDLFSYCESCLLPFKVQCHVGYIPSGQRVVGLSKLSRVADVFAKRLQAPQRLADEMCSALQNSIKPAGVAVALQCWHIMYPPCGKSYHDACHPSKAPMQGWVATSVFSGSGVFEHENSDSWAEYLALLKFRGVNMEKKPLVTQIWCPAKSMELLVSNDLCIKNSSNGNASAKSGASAHLTMITAVATIIRSLGEDPSRKELLGTPHRFVRWLMSFQRSNSEMKFSGFNRTCLLEKVGCSSNLLHSELNFPFWSQCEHHLLPFTGVVHVGYFQGENSPVVERSILQAVVHFYGCKLQVQERLTRQIAETISSIYELLGVMVVVEASHICMISRGIEKMGSNTATIAVIGQFASDLNGKARFLEIVSDNNASSG